MYDGSVQPLSVAFLCFPQSNKIKKTRHSKQIINIPFVHFAHWLTRVFTLVTVSSVCVEKKKRSSTCGVLHIFYVCYEIIVWFQANILGLKTRTTRTTTAQVHTGIALTDLNPVCVLKSLWSGASHLPLHYLLFFYPTDWPVCGRLSVFCFLCQKSTLLCSWFPPLTVTLPFVFLSSFASSALSLLLWCCLLLLPALPPPAWRVSIVCNDSVLSAGFQIDTPDTLGRTCLHAAAAGGWGCKRSGWFQNWGPSVSCLRDGSRLMGIKAFYFSAVMWSVWSCSSAVAETTVGLITVAGKRTVVIYWVVWNKWNF